VTSGAAAGLKFGPTVQPEIVIDSATKKTARAKSIFAPVFSGLCTTVLRARERRRPAETGNRPAIRLRRDIRFRPLNNVPRYTFQLTIRIGFGGHGDYAESF
jgi:hypothetical protein